MPRSHRTLRASRALTALMLCAPVTAASPQHSSGDEHRRTAHKARHHHAAVDASNTKAQPLHDVVYATEDEFEFADDTAGTSLMMVGDFATLDAEAGYAAVACRKIEAQFQSETHCDCTPALHVDTTTLPDMSAKSTRQAPAWVEYGCKHRHESCWRARGVCAQPTYAGRVDTTTRTRASSSKSFNATTVTGSSSVCLRGLHVRDTGHAGDLCVTVESFVSGHGGIRKCLAALGRTACECKVCDNNKHAQGIQVDCSAVDERFVARRCDAISVVSGVDDGGASAWIEDYLPSF